MHAKAEATRQSVNKLGDVIAETIHTPHPLPSFRIFHASKLNRFHASEINNKPHDLFSSLIPGRLALFNTQGMSYPIFRATGDDRFLTDRNYTNKVQWGLSFTASGEYLYDFGRSVGDNCTKKMFAPLTTQKPLPAPTIEGLPNMFKLYSLDLTTQGPPDLLESGQLAFDLIGLLLGNILTFKQRSGDK